ncbi:MAG TPA: Ig-like domain-containing protein, partial [Mesotoga sp.]|nr:Ig-like domain-containing protein [Mesotoga sp.]
SVEGDSYTYEPDFESAGLKEVKIKVSDSNGEEKILVFEIDVVDVNRAPVAVLPSIAASIKETFTLGLDLKSFFTDPDGEELSFAILEGPGSIEGGNYKYTPSYNDQGEKTVTIVARDSSGLSANLPIIISVMDLNRSPRILLSDKMIDEGANLVVDLRMQSIDLDGDELTFTLMEGPGSVENAIYTFEPSFDESGDHTVTIQVSDGLASVTGEFMVEVVDVNRTPETTIKEIKSSIREGFSLGMNLTTFFSDPDGDELTLSLEGPGTLEGNGYTYSPGYEDSGEKFILVTASDGRGGGVTLPIIITVLDVNRLPEIKEPFPEVTLEEGKTVEIELGDFISDPDGDDLLFEIREGPGSIVDGKYVFEPRTGEAGQKDVMIKVSDGKSELTVPLKIFVEAGHRVVSITYALFSSGIDKVKLVAGSHEIISSGQRAELEVDWPLDFDTVSIWKVTEESADFIGAARITASSSSRNIPVVSEGGETKGSVRIELK